MSDAADATRAAGRLKRVARPLFALTALAFVVWAAYDLSRRWDSAASVKLALAPALLSVAPLLVGAMFQGVAWTLLIEKMSGRRVPALPALSLYLLSQLARYTPGKVGLPIVRMAGAERLGVKPATVGTSILIEMLSWTAVGGSLGFSLLWATSGRAAGVLGVLGRFAPLLLAGFVTALLVLLALDRARLPAFVRRVLAAQGTGALAPVRLPLVQALYWLSWAVHGYMLARAAGAASPAALSATGLFVIAPVAGFLALAAPGGMGVREAILSVGLAPVLGPAQALALALVSRGASLASEVLAWALVRPLAGRAAPVKPA